MTSDVGTGGLTSEISDVEPGLRGGLKSTATLAPFEDVIGVGRA
jgi:hypothetical protein